MKPFGMRVGESIFCAGYLLFALVAGVIFARRAAAGGDLSGYYRMCAVMTLLLGGGDAFHLIPRILVNLRGKEEERDAFRLGLGNLVSSITMTGFYLVLYRVMEGASPAGNHKMPEGVSGPLFLILALLAAVRILLCLLPQNNWFHRNGNYTMGILRNLPFVLIGVITVWYLVTFYHRAGLAILVTVSFFCYLAVVLFAKKYPMAGMLMIPKTVCYIWMIAIFLLG